MYGKSLDIYCESRIPASKALGTDAQGIYFIQGQFLHIRIEGIQVPGVH